MQETKCNSTTLGQTLSKAWQVSQAVVVDALGALGGLAIAWNTQALTLFDFHASHHLIQATFHILGTNIHGNLSNVYCPQDGGSKKARLDTIEELNAHRPHPLWIVAGDFNVTPWSFALRRQDRALDLVRRTVLMPSWPAGRLSHNRVPAPFPYLPIDHIYAGRGWETVSVERGPRLGSDHYPVVVRLAPVAARQR